MAYWNDQLITLTVTNAAGQASFAHLPPGSYSIGVDADQMWSITDTFALNNSDATTKNYSLHPAGTISGFVESSSGIPVENVWVNLSSATALQSARTDASGYYAFTNLIGGTYLARINGRPSRQVTTIDAGMWQHAINITLTNPSLTGHVVASNGSTPIASSLVLLMLDNDLVTQASTDQTGNYSYASVASGNYTLVALGPQGVHHRRRL